MDKVQVTEKDGELYITQYSFKLKYRDEGGEKWPNRDFEGYTLHEALDKRDRVFKYPSDSSLTCSEVKEIKISKEELETIQEKFKDIKWKYHSEVNEILNLGQNLVKEFVSDKVQELRELFTPTKGANNNKPSN